MKPTTLADNSDFNKISELDKSILTPEQVRQGVENGYYSILNGITKVGTISLLRQLTTPLPTVWVSGYHTVNDGVFGSNMFIWNSTSTATDNGGTVIKCTNITTGRYELRYNGPINVRWFGAKGDGVTDDTVAIQTALLAKNFMTPWTKMSFFIPSGEYLISSPIKFQARQSIYGESAAGVAYCTRLVANTNIVWSQYRGMLETDNYTNYGGDANYAHAIGIKDIEFDHLDRASVNRPEYGLVCFGVGEQAIIEGCSGHNFKIAPFFIVGYSAVLQIQYCSGWHSTYGIKFSRHPDPAYPLTGIAKGDDNGGSSRLIGFSGDYNTDGLIYADGTQIVDAVGIKSELNNPCIRIAGTWVNNNRQRWNITGYRSEHGSTALAADRNFVLIEGTGQPQIFIGAGACYNATNMIKDNTPNGRTIPDTLDGSMVMYDQLGPVDLAGGNMTLPPAVIMKSASTTINQNSKLTIMCNLQTNYALNMGVQYSGSDVAYCYVGTDTANKLWSVDGTTGQRFKIWGHNGSAMVPMIQTGDNGILLGMLATQKIGFMGTTPIAKPTVSGSLASGAALSSLLTALANLGLITNSTSV